MQNSPTIFPPFFWVSSFTRQSSVFQCAPQLASQGNFVNPLETHAIGSISNRLLFGFCLRSCFSTPKPQTKLNRLTVWRCLENARVRRIHSQKRLVPHHYLFTPLPHTCPDAIGSSFIQHQAQKPSFHSFHYNTLRRFVKLTDLRYFSFHSFTLPLEPSLQTRQVCEDARASCLSTCFARYNQSSHAHPPKKHRLFATTFYSTLLGKNDSVHRNKSNR